MIKIPNSGQHSVPNNSDLFGTLWYTKNITLDEEGYLKLSPRAISIQSEKDTTNIRLPVAFGRKNSNTSIIPQTEFALTQSGTKGYWVVLSEGGINFNVDIGTGVPTLSADSHGKWYRNLWHVTDDAALYSKAGIADVQTYTSRAALTTGKAHPIEVFKNRDTICVGNGNVVKQYTNAYAASTDLTLQTDFEVIGLSYSNYQMGVLTMLSPDTNSGMNQDPYFFVWSGATTEAEAGVPIGSDKAIAIAPFRGSWVMLTRSGQFKYWTGGGFSPLTTTSGAEISLPFYFQKLLWGQSYSRDLLGDVLQVDGDVIYLNFNGLLNSYGKNYEQYLQNCPGGVWCVDLTVGVYHRASPSISPASILTVTSANVNTTTDIMTTTAGTIPSTGSPVKYVFDRSSQIGGLTTPTVYYCIKHTATTFSLATTKANADSGVKINLTSTGAANNYFLALEIYDYGQNIATKSGAMALFDVDSGVYEQMIFGAELNDYNTTGDMNHVNVLCDGFENRGYFVTPKIRSNKVEDVLQTVYEHFRPLDTNDKLMLKYKDREIIGLPVSTPQGRSATRNQCSWTGANAFSTTADLSDAKTAFDAGNDLECEIIAGAGAGILVKITDISENSGTYAVTLEENVTGATTGRYCDVLIDNWKVIGTITSSDTDNYKRLTVNNSKSSWFKLKGELRGVGTTMEMLHIVNQTHKEI